MFGTVFDTEGNGLTPDKFYTMAWQGEQGVWNTNSYENMREVLTSHTVIVGHNIARWDLPNLERVLEFKVPKETLVVDTLALCWYLYPDRPNNKNGLATWGEEFGISKPEIDDWNNLTQEEYEHRCVEDVKINQKLWEKQYKYLKKIYGSDENIKKFLRYLAFKMDCAREQERSKWKLDKSLCETTLEKLEAIKKEKTDELKSVLPFVPIVVAKHRPKKPYKSNGEPSAIGVEWFKLLKSKGLPDDYEGTVEVVTGYDEPNPNSHPQLKDWLFSLGWKPRTFKTNDKGEEVPQINKSKQDGGGLCESISELAEEEPSVTALAGLFVVSHRIAMLNGFLRDVDDEGYLTARVHGLTNTLRFKHTELVNLPKVDAPYGAEIRGCLIASEGFELCGSDMSSLEDRTKQHYMWPYDPEYVKTMMIPGFDPHLDLAQFAKKLTEAQVEEYKSGVYEPIIKTIRGIFKNGNYSCTYGAGPPKIAKTTGLSLEEAKGVHTAYWERNWAIKEIAKACKVRVVDGQSWLYNPVSTFWYSLRNDKDRFSTLNQGTGVYCFDIWVGCVRRKRPQLTGQFHDEVILHVKKGYRDEIRSFLKECIAEANDILQLDRELDIGIEFGDNYAAIH